MKTKEELLKEISAVLADEFECDPAKLTADAKLYEDLDLDSLDAVDLIVRLQQQTGIKFAAENFKSIRTLGDVAEVVERIISQQAK